MPVSRIPKQKRKDMVGLRKNLRKLASQKLGSLVIPTFANIILTDLTATRLTATDSTKKLSSVSDLTSWIAGTTNRVTVADVGDGTVILSGPQDIHTGAAPTFAGGTFTEVVTGVLPTIANHLATKEYVDLSLGAFKTFFLSDTSGVGALNFAYPHETGEAQSSIVTAGLGLGDDQLVKGYITEAGEPGTTTLHDGVTTFHFHAKKGAANQRTTVLYAVLSWVDADGTSNKTTVTTTELSGELTDTETTYEIHTALGADVEIASTARLILDVYANVGSGAQPSVVSLFMEGTEDSYFTTEVDSGIWQNHGDVLDDLNTVGPVGADSEFLVGTGAGALAWESGATVRTSLGLGTGDSPTLTGLTLSGLTEGSVLFAGASGIISQDNSNFFWDDTNNRLGIGTAVPGQPLHIKSTTGGVGLRLERAGVGNDAFLQFVTGGVADWFVGLDNSPAANRPDFQIKTANNANPEFIIRTSGNVGIGTVIPEVRLHVVHASSPSTILE
ncbi:hypothetical protein LCGC14_1869530, partial [marine sediment metagenome]